MSICGSTGRKAFTYKLVKFAYCPLAICFMFVYNGTYIYMGIAIKCILLVYHLDFVMFRVEINNREIAHPQEILQSPGRIVITMHGITKRCRLFGLTNNALVYEL